MKIEYGNLVKGIEKKLWEFQGSQQSITCQQELLGHLQCSGKERSFKYNFSLEGPQIKVRM